MATVKVEGLRELEAALSQLPKATAKATLRRTLKAAAEPTRAAAQAKAPRETGRLQTSIIVGTKLTRRQRQQAKREGTFFSEIHVGTANQAAVPQEFGTVNHPAQPFMRPAWDVTQDQALEIIKDQLGNEIEKSAARLARKAARAKG